MERIIALANAGFRVLIYTDPLDAQVTVVELLDHRNSVQRIATGTMDEALEELIHYVATWHS